MGVISMLQLAIALASGVAAAFHKANLVDLAQGVEAALAKLQEVHGQAVLKAELESLRITPQW